jgi:hypothetical protein
MSESYDASIGEAYIAGMRATRASPSYRNANPYYEGTRQHAAWASGYRDEKAWQANNDQAT